MFIKYPNLSQVPGQRLHLMSSVVFTRLERRIRALGLVATSRGHGQGSPYERQRASYAVERPRGARAKGSGRSRVKLASGGHVHYE
jgi:hypothetical protein